MEKRKKAFLKMLVLLQAIREAISLANGIARNGDLVVQGESERDFGGNSRRRFGCHSQRMKWWTFERKEGYAQLPEVKGKEGQFTRDIVSTSGLRPDRGYKALI